MDGFLTAQAFDIEKLANFGVPAALLFYFIIYSARIYQQLSAAITRQGEMLNQTIAAVVDRFDRALERHEAMVNNIAQSNARLMEEIARTSAAIQGAVQSMAEMVKSVAEADRKSHDDARELMIRLQSRYMGDEK
jgi:hypothetical protein